MKRNRNNIAVSIIVLFIAAIYFFVATSHIFLLKNRTQGDKKPHIQSNTFINKKIGVFYSRVDDVSLIKLMDKTTIEQKKTLHDFIHFTAEFFVTILFILTIWQLKLQSYDIKRSWPLLNYKEHYLSLCTLRI